ncbi:MAG: acyltransferase family protein [Lachnospiraceae bacterium]|nr:acyltransferase family protein [Lachnospiraceae bacterium]
MTDAGKKTTDYRFKLLYAISMIVIVSAHCDDGAINLFYDWVPYMGTILSVLIFASGYFYKSSAEEAPLAFLWKKCKRLIIPMYLWNLVYGFLVAALRHFGFTIGGEFSLHNLLLAPIYDGHQFAYNLAGWYVVPLFIAEAIYLLLRLLLSRLKLRVPETLILLFALGIGVLGLQLSIMGYREGWWLLLPRTAYFFAFFAGGVYYKRVLEKHDRLPHVVYFGLIILAQLAMLYFFHRMPIYVISTCESFPEGPLLPFIVGAIGVAFWLRVARILEPGLGKDRVLNAVADHSYSIMIHQFMGFMFVKTLYALAAKYTGHFADFDMERYKTDLWYYYTPERLPYYSLILYLIAGVALPVVFSIAGKAALKALRSKVVSEKTEGVR